MRLYSREDSPFLYVALPDGRRVSTGESNRRKAAEAAKRILAEQPAQAQQDMTLADALDAYVARTRANGGESSADAYRRLADKTLGLIGEGSRFAIPGTTRLSKIDGPLIERLRIARALEGNKAGTLGNELRLLRAAGRYAAEILGARPMAVTKWDVPADAEKDRYLSREEYARLLEALDPDRPSAIGRAAKVVAPNARLRTQRQDALDLVVVLTFTGARWQEAASLTRSRVEAKIATLYAKKTGKSRSVPLIDEVVEVIARRCASTNGELLFPGAAGDVPRVACRQIGRAMDAAGLNDPSLVLQYGRATIHTLRHTYASWLRQAGLGLDEIQPLLGHASISQTKRYARVQGSEVMKRAAAALAI
ncbi:tyrosine-type recombinase/integrase [Roseomonas sp. WA12]